jgi:hypothetical protein
MRKSMLLTTVLALVTVAAAILSAQSALDQLKVYTESAPGQSKAGAPPAAPKGTAPAAQLPDIVGIRLGMPLRDAFTILQTAHATVKLGMYPITVPGIAKPVLEGFSFLSGYKGVGITEERVSVHLTPPPNQQVVWKVVRQLSQQKIYRANVLSSLREKYGKETGTTPFVANDQQITDMWWTFDEQGHPAKPVPGPSDPDGVEKATDCSRRFSASEGGSSWFAPNNLENSVNGLNKSDWCNSSGIGVHASFGPAEIVTLLLVETFNVPLAVRSAKAEMAFVNDVVKRQQQQQIDQAKQAKPKL